MHVVSRSRGDFIIKSDDSISRTHATLELDKGNLYLIDNGSKYGTYLNAGIDKKVKLEANTKTTLRKGDKIRFGLTNSKYALEQLKIVTLTSQIKPDKALDLQNTLSCIGGAIVDKFSDSCTHLTMDSIYVTIKVLLALVANIPIVTPKYWQDLSELIFNESKIIHDCSAYLPPRSESLLRDKTADFHLNPARKVLFEGKKFYFITKKNMDLYSNIITMAGMYILNRNKTSSIHNKLILKVDPAIILETESLIKNLSAKIRLL